jgi:hypothetical protein
MRGREVEVAGAEGRWRKQEVILGSRFQGGEARKALSEMKLAVGRR